MNQEELLHILALKKAPLVGDTWARRLLSLFGSAQEVFAQSDKELLAIDGFGKIKLKGIRDSEIFSIAQKELAYIEKNNIQYHVYTDSSYPARLKHCPDAPIIQFHRGNINLENKHIISIVGTRSITTYGTTFLESLLDQLRPLDPIIVSGYAYGTDITTHKLCMKYGLQTIACLAHGLNQTYPKIHASMNSKMEENGGFITDFYSSDTFDRHNFLARNRVIAGLSEATVVIESAEKGGSLVTANFAGQYNRELFALPGRFNDTLSIGCNNLIKAQKAHPITTAADLVYHLGWDLNPSKIPVQKSLFIELNEDEKKVWKYLNDNPKEILDIIAIRCDIPVHQMAGILLTMEMKGVVKPLPGKLFELC